MIPTLDWCGIWNWIVANSDGLLVLVAGSAAGAPIWAIVAIAGCLGVEGIRRMIKVPRLLHHVREFERAEIEHRLGVIEKPTWEREQKRTKEVKIGDRIYHPLQRSPGGLWLQIASKKDDVQSHVSLVGDLQKLIHTSIDSHSRQHRREAGVEAALGVLFLASGAFVCFAYYILNLRN